MVITANHFKEVTNGYEKRTDGLFLHTGRFVVRGGPVDLPAGSIGMDELAPNSTQQQIGYQLIASSWTVTAINAWQETNVFLSATCMGAWTKVEFSGTLMNPAAQTTYITLALDTTPNVNLGAFVTAAPGQQIPMSVFCYMLPPAGTHRFSVMLYSNVVGSGLNGGIFNTLSVWEYRR